MTRKANNILFYILSVLLVLSCLLVSSVGMSNAWFTAEHKPGIQLDVVVSADVQLNLYQTSVSTANKIDVLNGNATKFVTLSGKIQPDATNSLKLILKNEEITTEEMYIRYKFEIYALTMNGNVLVPCEISGYDSGFVKNNDGYYYYASGRTNQNFVANKEANLLTSFKIPYSSYMDSSANPILNGSESLKILVTIEGSLDGTF